MREGAFRVKNFFERNVPAWLFILGAAFRLKHFLDNRSFWLDETYLGITVYVQTLKEIFLNKPCLSDLPMPPMGFMFFEKISTLLWGNNELALRFFPLVFGVAGMFVFYRLAKRHLNVWTAVLALAFFVFSEQLIYYAAEMKQYGLDVLVACLLFLVLGDPAQREISKKKYYAQVLCGMAAVTSSHPAAFILAAYGSVRFFVLWKRKAVAEAIGLIVQAVVWLLVFWLWFMNSFQHMIGSEMIMKAGQEKACFFPVRSGRGAFVWLGKAMSAYFKDPGGWGWNFVPMVLSIIGIRIFWKKNPEQCLFFALPLGFALAAAGLQKYFFMGRMLLFSVPALFLFVAQGTESVSVFFQRYRKGIAVMCVWALLILPTQTAFSRFVNGIQREEARLLVNHIKENFQPQDVIIVNEFAKLPLTYYFLMGERLFCFDLVTVTNWVEIWKGREAVPAVLQRNCFSRQSKFYLVVDEQQLPFIWPTDPGALAATRGRKKWVFFSHSYPSKEIVLKAFSRISTLQYQWVEKNAELYVFSEH